MGYFLQCAAAPAVSGWVDQPRGVYCQHGKRIMVPESDEPYSGFVFTEPWPCDEPECTREKFEQRMQEEQDEYEAECWREYYRLTYGY